MNNLTEFRPHLPARQAHAALQECVSTMDRAQHCAVLWFGEIMFRKLYRKLGHSTMRAYALAELGFSATRAGDFMRLASKLEALPLVKAKIASGEIGYTKAREIIKVADQNNEHEWVDIAQVSSRRELHAVVQEAVQAAREDAKQSTKGQLAMMPRPKMPTTTTPVRVGFELTPAQNARYEAMLAKIGHRCPKADLLLNMVEALLTNQNIAPRGAIAGPRYQVHVHKCPSCESHTVAAPNGDNLLSQKEIDEISCDANISAPGQKNKAVIPPKRRREVLVRDRHRCRRKGCHHTRHLDLHHLVPRARGGGNHFGNLVTLCTACHHLWHEQGGDLRPLLREIENPSPE